MRIDTWSHNFLFGPLASSNNSRAHTYTVVTMADPRALLQKVDIPLYSPCPLSLTNTARLGGQDRLLCQQWLLSFRLENR